MPAVGEVNYQNQTVWNGHRWVSLYEQQNTQYGLLQGLASNTLTNSPLAQYQMQQAAYAQQAYRTPEDYAVADAKPIEPEPNPVLLLLTK